ncbi:MAG: Methylmalonyl-CoA mutase [Crocinitomicaceae bacterium]|jgi:methylmalonyl-CoA mutase|nr:Methylmalonyl-CoA mutase [Crocinitomicaceae bacterium]
MKLFEQFPKSGKQEWVDLLTKELKGADFESALIKTDPIEELSYPSFFHNDDVAVPAEVPGKFPYRRGFFNKLNDWSVAGEVVVENEKTANAKALDILMKGSTALLFDLEKTQKPNLEILFKDIELQYITVYFKTRNRETIAALNAYFETHPAGEILLAFNPLAQSSKLEQNDLFTNAKAVFRNFEVDAYSIQQSGANCAQEIAFALSLGHEYLAQQLENGRNSDDALLNIHFTFGIGSAYLFEIAKLRAFRMLWAKIARSYKPEHSCNETASITSKTGFLNKSLQDPHTNLLRQTTEVMSAVLGGANHIINQPYDKLSMDGPSENAERMATNISLILKEESYLEQVLDACGGSYAIESLTESLADKAWDLFREIEKHGGLFNSDLFQQIRKTAEKRIAAYQNKQKTLIGVNKFPNPDTSGLQWKETQEMYFGLPAKILEQELTLVKN